MKETVLTILASAGILALVIWFAVWVSSFSRDEYKQTCTESGGKPVFNGKHWECIK